MAKRNGKMIDWCSNVWVKGKRKERLPDAVLDLSIILVRYGVVSVHRWRGRVELPCGFSGNQRSMALFLHEVMDFPGAETGEWKGEKGRSLSASWFGLGGKERRRKDLKPIRNHDNESWHTKADNNPNNWTKRSWRERERARVIYAYSIWRDTSCVYISSGNGKRKDIHARTSRHGA